jgi:hypothetical protein
MHLETQPKIWDNIITQMNFFISKYFCFKTFILVLHCLHNLLKPHSLILRYVSELWCDHPNSVIVSSLHRVFNWIGGVMVSMLASSVVDSGFKTWSGLTKVYEIGICCFSAKHTALRRKNTYWLGVNKCACCSD